MQTHRHGVDRHIDRGVDRHIDRGDRQTKYAGTHTNTYKQNDRQRQNIRVQTHRQKERLTNIQVQTHRQKDRQTKYTGTTHRQKDRQTKYTGTNTQTEGQRDRLRDSGVIFKVKFSIKLISEMIFQ